ncbi:MAG: hypothetical protein K6E51_05775 [Treponema sp.]|nr:hypothetical protein [Treponema sp.]
MSECITCGKPIFYTFHTLEVHTLPVRDFAGEKKVQALGKKTDFGVCSECAKKQYDSVFNICESFFSPALPAVVLLLLGIVLTFYFWNRNFAPFKMVGMAAIFCSITVLYSKLQKSIQLKKELESVDINEALEKAAWLCVLKAVPKKYEDNDLSYIPINKKTLALKKGDLMVLYNLLPQIAVQAYDMMHADSC